MVLTNFLTPRLVARHGERVIGATGMLSVTLGLFWMAQLDATSTFTSGLLGPFAVLGLGAGLTIAPLTTVIIHQAPADPVSYA